jgi:hypothetical protein
MPEKLMDKIFSRLAEDNFTELAGLLVDASIPIPEHLVNEIIQAELRGNRNISSCQVNIRGDNRVLVDLKTPRWPWPINLKLKLFNSVELKPSPKIRAFLENNLLLGKLGSFFKGMPDWIFLYNNQIAIDLDAFMKPDHKRLLALVKSLEIKTEENKIILNVTARVD